MKKQRLLSCVCEIYWSNFLKYARHDFLDWQLPRNDKLYYLGDKTKLFFRSEKNAAILDLWVKYMSIYLKYTRNEFIDHKSPRDHKLHIHRWQIKIIF